MKYLVIFALFLVSCGQVTTDSNPEKISANLTYFKDSLTGICFASINSRTYNSYEVTAITCVPCDSVKHLLK